MPLHALNSVSIVHDEMRFSDISVSLFPWQRQKEDIKRALVNKTITSPRSKEMFVVN